MNRPSALRLLLRVSAAFSLDVLETYRNDRDFVDALIIATLMQQKAARVTGDIVGQRQHAFFATPVPEHLRRPISINGVAASLNLPFETVRRRVKDLIADGVCEAAPEGVRFSPQMIGSEAESRSLKAVRALYLRLKRNDCLDWMQLRLASDATLELRSDPPLRVVWRVACDYFLRLMEDLLHSFPNPTRAFIMLEIVRANTAAMPDDMRGDDRLDVEAFVPDEARQPVSAKDVAERLKLPRETVRRHIGTLVAEGFCLRISDGVIVPRAVIAQGRVGPAMAANLQNLRRMFTELAETGVLARWDAEAENRLSARALNPTRRRDASR